MISKSTRPSVASRRKNAAIHAAAYGAAALLMKFGLQFELGFYLFGALAFLGQHHMKNGFDSDEFVEALRDAG